jgi:hypothetical protein
MTALSHLYFITLGYGLELLYTTNLGFAIFLAFDVPAEEALP